jgi:hypothetical protein
MEDDAGTGIEPRMPDHLLGEATAALTAALRNLCRLHGGDEEAVGRALHGALAAATDRPEDPIVIKVESLGAVELVTLREYIEDHVQDWWIGLEDAARVLAEAPEPLVHNADDAIRHPEYLQLHSALDERLLRAEIERLEKEEDHA